MLSPNQLQLAFPVIHSSSNRDSDLEAVARNLLSAAGAVRLSFLIRVEWNARLKTCAGRADSRATLVSLNPRLREYGQAEIDRTIPRWSPAHSSPWRRMAHCLLQTRNWR